ncbi:FtsW/RodA/SpoVE family cell cycle protein [Aliterella atlantica]|uniref:Probable peptidoglycan glycosyltransferase FtsW n=1 Tax=Aliterella atlantica CENA595 TaxID=1618023 RepID=A0A0D8ZUD3_9CYAN|nr:FtsW/RodA/SpoVE family cell cycle protein [Aliterella atlantica]KJH72069.1 cell division protein FtsW [Aliterella atlantica CENA595]
MELRQLIPLFDASTLKWASRARLLRWLTLLWVLIGLVILFSASYAVGEADFGDGLYYIKRQLISIVIGLVIFNFVVHSPLQRILGVSHWFVLLFLALIFVTLIPGLGTNTNGAARWLPIGSFQLQPSELIKPFLVVQSARVFGQWQRLRWQSRLIWLGIFALVLAGILLQPNLSTTALCGMALWLIALAAGLPYIYLIATAMGGVMLAYASISLRDYQKRRVMSFLNPWADPMQDGYQLIQSLLAIGSGGAWGTGYGLSQQKLFYLPIQYTDFIFAVFAEEFGFVGCLLFLLLLATYGTLALIVAFKAENAVHRLIAIGAMIFMVGQSLLNIGVASGGLPTTGLPLPLVSYGGNSVIASLLIAGLLVRVARESSEAKVVSLPRRSANNGRSHLV